MSYERLDGKGLGEALDALEGHARKLKLPPLSGFFGMDLQKARSVTEMSTGELPVLRWFEPAKALPTVRGLLKHLRENPGAEPKARGGLLQELKTLEGILAQAQKDGAKFHLLEDG